MVGMMLLMAGCSTDDVVKETTSAEGIAISFSCNYDNEEENETRAADQDATGITRTGQQGAMNTEDLYATGFGVMASVTAGNAAPYDNKPNLMYNQEVKYTFVGDMAQTDPDDPDTRIKGYWSYYPLKYWPTDLEHCYISAYAPYVEPSELEGLSETKTGIVGISGNNETPYITYRRCKKPNEVVDLLWYYKKFENTDIIPEATATKPAGTLNMKMHHALARLEIQVALAAPASGTKVLIEEITLTGEMTKTANLILNKDDGTGDNHYPHWEALATPDTENRTIQITNIDNDDDSYGIIDAPIRYIPGMPYNWQPDGLTTTAQNALSTGDRQTYIYLIPQENWSVTVQVKYKKLVEGQPVPESSTKSVTTEANPLKGNTPYVLNITLSDI